MRLFEHVLIAWTRGWVEQRIGPCELWRGYTAVERWTRTDSKVRFCFSVKPYPQWHCNNKSFPISQNHIQLLFNTALNGDFFAFHMSIWRQSVPRRRWWQRERSMDWCGSCSARRRPLPTAPGPGSSRSCYRMSRR